MFVASGELGGSSTSLGVGHFKTHYIVASIKTMKHDGTLANSTCVLLLPSETSELLFDQHVQWTGRKDNDSMNIPTCLHAQVHGESSAIEG